MEHSLFRWVTAGRSSGKCAGLPRAPAQPPAPPPPPDQTAQPQPLPSGPVIPGGTVIFSRKLPDDTEAPAEPVTPVAPKTSETEELKKDDPLKVTDTERDALTFTAYDLDVHLTPAKAGISVRAGLTVRNDSSAPLGRLVLQISSSLHWDAFSSAGVPGHATAPLSFVLRRVATDADHTGWAQEAVVTLPQPLAPGASITLTALYSGAIPHPPQSASNASAHPPARPPRPTGTLSPVAAQTAAAPPCAVLAR